MWLMPDSNERILPQATPVPITTAKANDTAMTRSVRAGICPGYLREGREPGSAGRRARLVTCLLRSQPESLSRARAAWSGGSWPIRPAGRVATCLALTSSEWDITDATAAERFIEAGDVVINCAAYTDVDAAETDETARPRRQRRRARPTSRTRAPGPAPS